MEDFEFALTAEGEKYLAKYNGSEKNVVIPADCEIVAVGDDAFLGNDSIVEVSVPETVEQICSNAFFGCKNLRKITVSENLQEINIEAFRNCVNLEEINFPKSLRTVGPKAFENCPKLKVISSEILPSFLMEVSSDSFDFSGKKGETKEFLLKNPLFKEVAGVIYNSNSKTLLFACDRNLESVKIEKEVKYIAWNAFAFCKKLKSVTVSSDVHYIGRGAFEFCTSLEKIILPNKVVSIDSGAFSGCENLKEVIVQGDGLKFIAENAFTGCGKLFTITVPADCEIQQTAFDKDCNIKRRELRLQNKQDRK